MTDRLLSLAFEDLDLAERIYWTIDVKAAMVAHGLGKPRSKITAADVAQASSAREAAEARICECEARVQRIQVAIGISPSDTKWTDAREQREKGRKR